jgi:hypothetical protein
VKGVKSNDFNYKNSKLGVANDFRDRIVITKSIKEDDCEDDSDEESERALLSSPLMINSHVD